MSQLPKDATNVAAIAGGATHNLVLRRADLAFFQAWASTNLVNWVVLSNGLTLTNGALWLQDAAATNSPRRFYRLIELGN